MDDAASKSRARRSAPALAALALIGAVFGAILAIGFAPRTLARHEVRLPWSGAAVPDAARLPAAIPGQRVELRPDGPHGAELIVQAPDAAAARDLARVIARLDAGAGPGLAALEARLLDSLRAEVPLGPALPMSRGSEVGALLLAEASLRQALAEALANPAADDAAVTPLAPSLAVLESQQTLDLALVDAPPAVIESALIDAAGAETEWLADRGGAGLTAADLGRHWRAWQRSRAESLTLRAQELLASESALQQSLAAFAMPAARARLASARGPVSAALARTAEPPPVPAAVPIAGAWALLIGTGALTGAAAASLGGALAGGRGGRRRASALVMRRDPAATDAWLHVVCGPDRDAVARGLMEVASHPLARGQRVLVIDASARLRLHERLGREARWGLMECLHCDMPVLGLVQYGGLPGLYLLAHGEAKRAAAGWSGLGRRLDEARPHFARIVLCIDRGARPELGDALLGRPLEGWWAESAERLPRAAEELPGRLGIAFSCMDLRHFPEPSLERLGARAAVLALAHPPRPAAEPAAAAAAPPAERPAPAAMAGPPEVLDCDLQVQQRLRFLAWMRRVQSESRREELEPVA